MTSRMTSRSRNYPKRLQKTDCDAEVRQFCEKKIDPPGFIKYFINKEIGFGVFTTKEFAAGDFLLQYPGDLISKEEADERDIKYREENKGCFLYMFKVLRKEMCFDATNDTRLGKYINDSPNTYANAKMKLKTFSSMPCLCLYATKDMPAGTEIRYNYDDKSMEWRNDKRSRMPFLLSEVSGQQIANSNEKEVDFAVWTANGNYISIDVDKKEVTDIADRVKIEDGGVGNGEITNIVVDGVEIDEGSGVSRRSEMVNVVVDGVEIDEDSGANRGGEMVNVVEDGVEIDEDSGANRRSEMVDVVGDGVKIDEDSGANRRSETVDVVGDGVKIDEDCGANRGSEMVKVVEDSFEIDENSGANRGSEMVKIVEDSFEIDEDSGANRRSEMVKVVEDGVEIDEDSGANRGSEMVKVVEDDVEIDEDSGANRGSEMVKVVEDSFEIDEDSGADRGSEMVKVVEDGVEIDEDSGADRGSEMVNVVKGGVEIDEDSGTNRGNETVNVVEDGVEIDEDSGANRGSKMVKVVEDSFEIDEDSGANRGSEMVDVVVDGVKIDEHSGVSRRSERVNAMVDHDNINIGDMDEERFMNRYADLIRKNSNNLSKIKDVLGDFAQKIGKRKTDANEEFPMKRKAQSEDPNPKRQKIQDNKTSEVLNPEEKETNKCPECNKVINTKLKRHLKNVHSFTEKRAKSYMLSKAYDGKVASGGRLTKSGKIDYHILKECPYDHCYVVRTRLGPHLVDKHKLIVGTDNYKSQLKNAKPWKGMVDKSTRDKMRMRLQRDSIREEMENNNCIIPVFTKTNVPEIYVPESKTDFAAVSFQEGRIPDADMKLVSNEHVFKKFFRHMTSLDGGHLERSSAELYSQEVKHVLKSLETDDFTSLFDKKKMRESFLNYQNDDYNYKPATKQKYLTALIHFCNFALNNDVNILNYTKDDILSMRTIYTNWRKSLNKEVQLHESVRNEDEVEAMISPDQVRLWDQSESKREAIKLLGEFSSKDPSPLTKSKYCAMRDYFFVEISLQNSHRSGVCSNLSIEEFEASKPESVEGSNFMMMKVKKHKTVRSHGYAKLYLTHPVFAHLKIFVNDVRFYLQGQDSHIFVSFNGRQMTSGEVSTQINSIWQRSGVYGTGPRPTKNITCTQFRKSVSTLCLEHKPEASRSVADLLAHGSNTQQKYYDVRRREKSSALGALNISRIFRGVGQDEKHTPCHSVVGTEQSDNDNLSSPSRKKWTIEEVQELRKIFKGPLENEEPILINDIDNERKRFCCLAGISNKKIYDKLRNLSRYKNSTVPTNQLPTQTLTREAVVHSYLETNSNNNPDSADDENDEGDDEWIAPSRSSCVSGKEKKFSPENVQMLRKLLGGLIQLGPRTARSIRPKLEQSKEGKQLIEEFGITAIVNRAKYEKKMLGFKL